jgi:Bacterial PH domain
MTQNSSNSGDNFSSVQCYHILKAGDSNPTGPFSKHQVDAMISGEQIKGSDFIYFPEANGWKRISELFYFPQEIGKEFSQEGQDAEIVAESFKFINERAQKNENLYYIAVQELPALSLTAAVRLTMPKSIVITDKRICILEPKLVGKTTFQEVAIAQIKNGLKHEPKTGANTGAFVFVLLSGEWLEIPKIPVQQLIRLEETMQWILAESKPTEEW